MYEAREVDQQIMRACAAQNDKMLPKTKKSGGAKQAMTDKAAAYFDRKRKAKGK